MAAARALGAGRGTWCGGTSAERAPDIVLATSTCEPDPDGGSRSSFLGLGTQLPEASWGNMLNEARGYVYQSVWDVDLPGAAIMLVVLGFNFLGDGLRDVLDPRLVPRRRRARPPLERHRLGDSPSRILRGF